MESRSGARPLTQRTFDENEAPPPEGESPAPTLTAPPPDAPAMEPISRDPSDRNLRDRQLKWIRERERAVRRAGPPEPETPR